MLWGYSTSNLLKLKHVPRRFVSRIKPNNTLEIQFGAGTSDKADEEIIPELLQSSCNPSNIYNTVDKLLSNKKALDEQIMKSQEVIKNFKTEESSNIASSVLNNYL